MQTFSKKRTIIKNLSWLSLAGVVILLGGCTRLYDDTAGWGARFYDDAKNWVEHLDDPSEAENQAAQMPQMSAAGQMAQSGTPDVVFKPAEGAGAGMTATTASEFADTTPAMAPAIAPGTQPTWAVQDTQRVAEALRLATPPAPAAKTPAKTEAPAKAETPVKAETMAPAGKETKMAAKTEGKMDKPEPGKAADSLAIHLSSLRSIASAKREWDQLQKAHPRLLGSLAMTVERTDLGKRGVFYRVLAGPLPDRSAASGICAQLKAKKQYCKPMSSKPQSHKSKKTV